MAHEDSPTNLIINYLPQTLSDEEFHDMFATIGALKSSKVVRDNSTGYSYGFGFVDYTSEEDAQRAIDTLNGLQLQNKRIKVAYSRKGGNIKNANLYVTNLPHSMTQTSLEEIFAPYGQIIQSRILVDPGTGTSKGVGFVLFNTKDEADTAKSALEGTVLPGAVNGLSIKFAEQNKGKAGQVKRGGGNIGGGFGGGGAGGYGGGMGNGYGAAAGFGGLGGGYGGGGRGAHGGGAGRGFGPMRNQNRGSRFNPMAGGGAGFNGNQADAGGDGGHILFVYNIGPEADERDVWQLFAQYGTILKVNVIRDHAENIGKGYGFVTMTKYQEAMAAIQSLNGYNYSGKPLQVSFKSDKK